ncbi:hypothetical protein [Demequina globuliformis]|uniref:hypothetical protein n=1 Tax=Demequina globuliformis TaxID=676202 RepID=UPI0007846AF0|nr:hypothetical protein [Demequina globuliformis]
MAIQSLPRVASDYARDQRAENGAAVAAVKRLWRRMGSDFDASFLAIAPDLIEVSNTAQARISGQAQAYIPAILEATDQAKADRPRFDIDPGAYVGTAGDGRPTEVLMYGAVTEAKKQVKAGASESVALHRAGEWIAGAVGTILSDTHRGMEGFESYARPVSGWVRQLTPPSCGRCVILAGKHYRKSQGFQRHPGCDCVHIPAAENVAGDLTTDVGEYLGSLDEQGLAKALGSKANALAYAEFDADPYQIVNAYSSGVKKAQQYGRNITYTTEGTTVRGVAYQQMSRVRALSALSKSPGSRYRQLTAPRLMPETIIGLGLSQERTRDMLRDFGWLGYTRP